MMTRTMLTIATILTTICAIAAPASAKDAQVAAPDFDGADGWLNTAKPISLKELKGHVVVLDFWTYCCINCLHVLPDLKYLEQKYKDQPFVVIGVHSGKFDQEKDAEHIRNAVLRHNIDHPVAVDSDYKIWNSYEVTAWPTTAVIDPEGNYLGRLPGEGNREVLDTFIGKVLEQHKAKGTLAAKPLTFKRERETFKSGTLEFPGKVLADAKGKRLFISDTNHHRILVSNFDGKVSDVIGAGTAGLVDGAFDKAQFHQPQGMTLSEDGRTLYVADTENHAIRAVDLSGRSVATLAGNGKQGSSRDPSGPAKKMELNSPWDVARVENTLFIAMAGPHQIWKMDLKAGTITLHAGAGPESAIDGPNRKATFSQPSGFATDGKTIYVADSESSTIRAVEVAEKGKTTSVAGSNHLFGFGLVNAKGKEARFQHPLGVALQGEESLFVADSFNNVIRRIDLKTGDVTTWIGTGKAAAGNETAADIGFYEPGGISIAGDTLFIADTNHHRIVAVDLKTRTPHVLKIEMPK